MKKREKIKEKKKMKEINDMIGDLLEEEIVDGEEIVFTDMAVELIHKIAEKCNQIPIVKKTQEQAEEYAKGLSAEQVYLDMCKKIVDSPTRIHMMMTARMLIPVIEKKINQTNKKVE